MTKMFWAEVPATVGPMKWVRLEKIVLIEPSDDGSCVAQVEGGSLLRIAMPAADLVNEIKNVMEGDHVRTTKLQRGSPGHTDKA